MIVGCLLELLNFDGYYFLLKYFETVCVISATIVTHLIFCCFFYGLTATVLSLGIVVTVEYIDFLFVRFM